MNLETVNERKDSVNDATDATSKLFASIPSGKGTPIEEEESSTSEEDEESQEDSKDVTSNLTTPPNIGGGQSEEDSSEEGEEDEEESEDDDSEDSQIVTGLFGEFGEVELESTDFENEDEAVKAYVGALSKREHAKGKDEGVNELFEIFPEAKQLVEHLNAGYTIETFMQEIQVPDYSTINLEEASDDEKVYLYKEYMKSLGNDEEDIEDAVEIAKDSGKLDNKAERAQKYLVNKHKSQIEERKAKEAEQAEAQRKATEEQNKKLDEILKTGDLEVANLDKNQSKELSTFLGDGKKRQETWKNLSLQKQLLVEYLVATDFKDINFSKQEAAKKVTQAVRIKKSKSNKTGIGNQGSPRVNLKNFANGRK